MKHGILLLLGMCLLLHTHAQQQHDPYKKSTAAVKNTSRIRIIGIAGREYNGEKVMASIASNVVNDSAIVQNGKFVIEAPFKEPMCCILYVKPRKKGSYGRHSLVMLVTRPGDIYLKVNMDSIYASTMSGMPDTRLYNGYQVTKNLGHKKLMSRLEAKYDRALLNDPDPAHPRYKELMADAQALKEEYKPAEDARLEEFITGNTHSFAALYELWTIKNKIEENRLQALFDKLGDEYKNTSYGQQLIEKITITQQLAIGRQAPEFEQPDTLGRMVKLSDFRGKYVLIDFWASWCKPCRMENPNVVAAYTKYSNRNFTVLGISLDAPNGKERWLEAIHKDGLTWTHLSDLKSWNNAVAKQYGIQAVPYNLLIGPDGKIIAKNLRGEELEKKLAEVIKG